MSKDGSMSARISEIFVSYQGEGTFMGSRQLFVRFHGCNLSCAYCDTVRDSYRSFTKEALLGKILDLGDDYNELVLTGGEPLLYGDFLKEFIKLFRKSSRKSVYLETNGTLPGEMAKIADLVDIVAMDIKLPSTTLMNEQVWDRHEKFLEHCRNPQLIVKAVVSDSTVIEDIKRMSGILKKWGQRAQIVLQPVTSDNGSIKGPDEEMLFFFKEYIKKEFSDETFVMGQMHKCMGIR